MLLSKEVEVRLCSQVIKYYEDKGYNIPRTRNKKRGTITVPKNTKIKVKVEDLSNSSRAARVDVQCDNCKEILNITWCDYKKYIHDDGKYYCRQCAYRLYGYKKMNLIRLNKSGVIADTHPHLIKYFVNEEDTYKYSAHMNKIVLMKCPDCGYEKEMRIEHLTDHGFHCIKCNKDRIPYSEKFMLKLLDQLNIEFKKEKTFNWSNRKRYDFYIPNLNMIIEMHGFQHYKDVKGVFNSLDTNIENDKLKYNLAIKNNIKYYIVLDCRKSELKWIKSSIMQSDLPILLNFKEENVDWLKCHEYSCNNIIKEVCDMWNNETNITTKNIKNKFNLTKSTIIKYLKKGAELGWCSYNPKEEIEKNYNGTKNNIFVKPVICLTTNKIFNSIKEAGELYSLFDSSISACCRGKHNYAGKHPETGEPLRWAYYNKEKGENKNVIDNQQTIAS